MNGNQLYSPMNDDDDDDDDHALINACRL